MREDALSMFTTATCRTLADASQLRSPWKTTTNSAVVIWNLWTLRTSSRPLRPALREITIDEYNSFCSYGLNDKSSGRFLLNGENDDDHDSAVGDLESDKEPEEDADKE
jgi:hypothetical protein